MSRLDAVVLGGGPAGCAAAMFAARAGLRVALLERATFPRPKPCGEGLMPSGAEVLRELGVWDAVRPLGRPFRGVRYATPAGRHAEGRFPAGAAGLAVRREDLDLALWRAARATPGVVALDGQADAAGFSAPLTAVCDGGRSRAAEAFGARRLAPARRRFGLSARFAGLRGESDLVEVFVSDGAELYLTPLPGGEATLAVLLDESAMDLASELVYARAIARCPALAARLSGARRSSPLRGAGPLGARADRVHGPGWLLAGDAAGALDPIVGDGVAAALITGRLAGKALAAAAGGDAGAFAGYARERESALRGRRWLAAAALGATSCALAAESAVALLGAAPLVLNKALALF